MVESLYQGAGVNTSGTHNAIMSSSEYLSQVPANPASATLTTDTPHPGSKMMMRRAHLFMLPKT